MTYLDNAGMLQEQVPTPSRARIGKRVGSAVYVHADAAEFLSESQRAVLGRALALARGFRWNVAKLGGQRASLLLYEDFDQAPFPTLFEALCIDLEARTIKQVDYRGR